MEAEEYTLPLAELLLEKMQIVQINDKDLKDAMLLLLAARLGDTDQDMINARYIAKLFSEDWGFCHTATTNLERIKASCHHVKALSDEQRDVITAQVNAFLKIIEEMPKSDKWKGRAKTGESKPWYKEVADWA